MPSAVCGWCGVLAHMPVVGDPVEVLTDYEMNESRVTTTHKCDSCGGLSLAYGLVIQDELAPHQGHTDYSAWAKHRYLEASNGLSWYPPAGVTTQYSHVPYEVASAAMEARKCMVFGALRAAVQLARSVVESTAKNKRITVNGVSTKIEEMFKQGLIREHIRDGAHEIRYLGNDMAHGDFTSPVTVPDASMVLTLMDEVLTEVYEGPGRVQEAKDRRAAREAAHQP